MFRTAKSKERSYDPQGKSRLFRTRFENEKGTNLEGLIAAAHAKCFSMTLAFVLQGASYSASEIEVEAAVTIEPEGQGFRISRSALTVQAQVLNLDEATFAPNGRRCREGLSGLQSPQRRDHSGRQADIDDVAPALASAGYRVIVPYVRGYGTTRFLSSDTFRNGQPSAVALDTVALMDALKIKKATLAGFDWGARTADITAALWPERCKALVAVSGYLIGGQDAGKIPLPPIVVHNYRWRLGLTPGEAQYDDLETKLAAGPGHQCADNHP
jgi:OsmC subfamily peroxiredoxin